MPALAPADSPLPPPLCPPVLEALDGDATSPGLELGVGAMKSSEVTLKQGTWMLKSRVSTNVCGNPTLVFTHLWLNEKDTTYNISASKEALILAVVLAFEFRPVLELDGSVLSCGYVVDCAKLVALVAWVDVRCVGDDLSTEVGLRCWVYARSAP